MSFRQTNTTNPLHIKRIGRHQVDLVVRRDSAGHPTSFILNSLSLDELQLPPQGRIKLFAYSSNLEQSVELGTVASPRTGDVHRLEIGTGSPFYFRIIVRDPDLPNILASCEGLRATEEADEAGRQHLLPVEPADLGEKLWELRFEGDGEPVLFVSDDVEVGMLAHIRSNQLFQALILPQAIELVLLKLCEDPGDDDDDGWKGKWTAYLSARSIEFPNELDEPEACARWAKVASHSFAKEHGFLTMVRKLTMEEGYAG